MIDFIPGLLMLTAFLLFCAVFNSYCSYRRELKITRDLKRLNNQREFDALYEDAEFMAEWQAKSGEDFIWN